MPKKTIYLRVAVWAHLRKFRHVDAAINDILACWFNEEVKKTHGRHTNIGRR